MQCSLFSFVGFFGCLLVAAGAFLLSAASSGFSSSFWELSSPTVHSFCVALGVLAACLLLLPACRFLAVGCLFWPLFFLPGTGFTYGALTQTALGALAACLLLLPLSGCWLFFLWPLLFLLELSSRLVPSVAVAIGRRCLRLALAFSCCCLLGFWLPLPPGELRLRFAPAFVVAFGSAAGFCCGLLLAC